jgi:cytochrome c biogenesis protein CcmG, thiol:disulfide interchange protein DsbE
VTVEARPGAIPAGDDVPSDGLPGDGTPGDGREALGRRGRHTARWIAGLTLVVIAALIALLATRPPATATEVYTPLLGQPAPALSGTTLAGAHVNLASYRGRWVWVNFSASWCPPCQKEEPALVTWAYQHRAPAAAALIGVVYDDSTASAQSFERSAGASWPAVIDPGGQIALRYGVRGPPESFLITPNGRVEAHLDGAVTVSDLNSQIAAAKAAGL